MSARPLRTTSSDARIAERGVIRVLELREDGPGYELDLSESHFTYNGAEGCWTIGSIEWLVYASHESSITFGGPWLIERMRRVFPEFDRYLYKGWDASAY